MAGVAAEYEPGACNIGPSERRSRFAIGIIGFFLAIAYLGVALVLDWPAIYALGAFVFVYTGVIGIFQGALGFCVTYGFMGKYNFAGMGSETQRVNRKSAREQDRRRAIHLSIIALIIAVALTAGIYWAVLTQL